MGPDTPTGLFDDYDSYLSLPSPQSGVTFKEKDSPTLTPPLSLTPPPPAIDSSTLILPRVSSNRKSPGPAVWANERGLQRYLDGERQSAIHDNISPMQTTNLPPAGLLSPPDSSEASPETYDPLNAYGGLLMYPQGKGGSSRIHGQVTPPDDSMQASIGSSANFWDLTQEPLQEKATQGRKYSISHEAQGNPAPSLSTRRRRSSTAQFGSRRGRKNSKTEESQDAQEAKRRKFLERNRLAASKCRQKKKAWMQDLETNAREKQSQSKGLKIAIAILREDVFQLKTQLLKHDTCSCDPIRQYLNNEAVRVAEGHNPVTTANILDDRRTSISSEFSIPGSIVSEDVDLTDRIDPTLTAENASDINFLDDEMDDL